MKNLAPFSSPLEYSGQYLDTIFKSGHFQGGPWQAFMNKWTKTETG